jgi:FkbM family methyltransferase
MHPMQNELRFSPKIEGFIKAVFKRFGVGITGYSRLEALTSTFQASSDLKFLMMQPDSYVSILLRLLAKSKAQFRQDLFALAESKIKSNGYFVEFGATNGVDLSNTYLLEKEFGWRGILAEPARIWHDDLARSRSCNIESKCVWSDTGSRLAFNETGNPDLSTVGRFSSSDMYASTRKYGKSYEVETISLIDLLDKYDAPKSIDYLSVDTEGSEFEILSKFDFERYKFGVITCEHNYTSMRGSIHDLLQSKGYVRKFQDLSQYDDWYVRA